MWLVAAGASAQAPLPLELRWVAPEACPTETEVRAELERVARVRPGTSLRPLSAAVHVYRRGASFRAELRTEHEGRTGTRTLEATDCRTLARSMTLVLALAFGPGVEVATEPEEPVAPADRPPPAAAPAPPPTREAPADAPEEEPGDGPPLPVQIGVLLGAGGTLNLLPKPAFGATAGVSLRLGAYSLQARALLWPAISQTLAREVEARLLGAGGALALCAHQALAANLELGVCGGARVVALIARTSGELQSGEATAPWTAAAASATLEWPRSFWLRARLELDLALSLSRPQFVVEGLREVHRVPQLVPGLFVAACAEL